MIGHSEARLAVGSTPEGPTATEAGILERTFDCIVMPGERRCPDVLAAYHCKIRHYGPENNTVKRISKRYGLTDAITLYIIQRSTDRPETFDGKRMITRKPEQLFGSAQDAAIGRRNSVSRPSYDERLNQILEAATGTIARVGYQRASVRAVAKDAGVSLAGLYHYFDSKERMLFLIQFRAFSSLLNNLKEKLHGVEDPVEQLRVMVRAHVGYLAANMAALKVCSHELDSLTGTAYDETRRIRHEYYKLTRSIVERIFEHKAAATTPDPHVVTMSLFGMLNWLYRWYDPRGGHSPNTLANQIAGLFLDGILGGHDGADHQASQPPEQADN